jgi:hypothetical protein
MCGATYFTIRNDPRRLTAITLSQSAASISVQAVSCNGANKAALLTSTSILPKRSMVAATITLTAASSVSTLATELSPCRAAISAASSRPSAISAIITRAPSAASAWV